MLHAQSPTWHNLVWDTLYKTIQMSMQRKQSFVEFCESVNCVESVWCIQSFIKNVMSRWSHSQTTKLISTYLNNLDLQFTIYIIMSINQSLSSI